MKNIKGIWNDEDLRGGAYYELAMEVSGNNEQEPIKDLTEQLFKLDIVKGPFNSEFEKVELDLDYVDNLGYFEIEGKQIPFKTVNVPEEGEYGSNWLDLCVHTGIYEYVLGKEFQTWSTNAKWHRGFDELLIQVLRNLNSSHKIRMALIGFEVSGMYNLEILKEKELTKTDVSHTKFFVNKGEGLKGRNWNMVNELP